MPREIKLPKNLSDLKPVKLDEEKIIPSPIQVESGDVLESLKSTGESLARGTELPDNPQEPTKSFKIPQKQVKKDTVFDKISETIIPSASADSVEYDEQKISEFIQHGKDNGKSKEQIKNAYNKAINDGIFDMQEIEETAQAPIEEDVQGLDLGVKAGEAISGFGEGLKFEAQEDDRAITSIAKFFGNLPGDTLQLAGDLVSVVSNPVGTVQSVDEFASSMVESGLNKITGKDFYTTDEKRVIAESVGAELKKISEDPSILKDMAIENPADILFSVTGGLGVAKNAAKSKGMTGLSSKLEKAESLTNPIKIQAQAIKKGVAGVKQGTSYVTKEIPSAILGKSTGAGQEAIKEAFKSGGKESFAKALKGETTDIDILNSAKKGFETIKEQRSEIYGKDYAKLIENKKKLGLNDIETSFVDDLEDAKVDIVPTDKGFELDFSKSTITQSNSKNQIQAMFDDIVYWSDDTPEGLDILKQRVQDRWIGGEGTGKADRFSTKLGNQIKNKIANEVPEYKNMTATYETLTNELREIDSILKLGSDKSRMTAITRLGQTLKDNLSMRKEVVDKLEELSGIDLKSSIAGASLRNVAPKGLSGVFAGTAGFTGLASGLFTPGIVAYLLASSPRLIGEIAKATGTTSAKLRQGLEKTQEISKGLGESVKNTVVEKGGDIVDNIADKTGVRAKFMDDGGTGISGEIDELEDLFNTSKYDNVDDFGNSFSSVRKSPEDEFIRKLAIERLQESSNKGWFEAAGDLYNGKIKLKDISKDDILDFAKKYNKSQLDFMGDGKDVSESFIQKVVKNINDGGRRLDDFGDSMKYTNMEDYDNFPSEVKRIFEKHGDDQAAMKKDLEKMGYKVDMDMDNIINGFEKKISSKKVFDNMEDYTSFPQEVQDIMLKYGDDQMATKKAMEKLGYKVDVDMDGTINSFSK